MKLRNFTSAPVCVRVCCVCVYVCVRVRTRARVGDGHNFASHHLGAGNVSCPPIRSPPAPVSTAQSNGMSSVCFHCLGGMRVLGCLSVQRISGSSFVLELPGPSWASSAQSLVCISKAGALIPGWGGGGGGGACPRPPVDTPSIPPPMEPWA